MTNHAEFEDLCAAAALGALDAADRDKLRAHLQTCTACRKRVAEFTESSTWLALGLAPIQPSAAVKSAVMARISGQHGAPGKGGPDAPDPADATGATGATGAGPGLLAYVALALAGLAIAGALAVGYLYTTLLGQLDTLRDEGEVRQAERDVLVSRVNQLEQAAEARAAELARAQATLAQRSDALAQAQDSVENLRLELASAERELERLRRLERLVSDLDTRIFDTTDRKSDLAGNGAGRVLWNGREVAFVAASLPPLPPGKSYELWTIEPGASGPKPAGVFAEVDPNGGLIAFHSLGQPPTSVDAFALSREQAGGAPNDIPTDVLMVITP